MRLTTKTRIGGGHCDSFFSPDPFVQAPDLTQNYNRYSYCMNNPVMYSDPDGELFGTVSGLVSDVFYNLFLKSDQDEGWDWSRTKNGWKMTCDCSKL